MKTHIRQTVIRSLSAVGAKQEAQFYAELFAAQAPERFALIVLDPRCLKNPLLEALVSDLRILSNLGLMSLQRRRERYSIIHCWKILHGLAPGSIKFNPLSPRGIRAVYPDRATSTARSRTIFENSFAVKAP